MGLNWGRQEKDLTQFQQFILIVMTKKETDCRKYKSRYFYNSLCSRICEISLYFSNLNTHCWIVLHSDCCARRHSDHPGGLVSRRTLVHAPCVFLISYQRLGWSLQNPLMFQKYSIC